MKSQSENRVQRKPHPPQGFQNGSFCTLPEAASSKEPKVQGVDQNEVSSKEAAFNILEKAKRDFTFRGGRMPSMTLESKSNSFYNIYGRDVSLWIIRQFEKAEILPRPDLKQAVADLLAAHAMKEGGREPAHRICQENDRLYYRLDDNRTIRITAGEVKKIKYSKNIAFWHNDIAADQATPDSDAKPDELLPLLKKLFRVKKAYRLTFAAVLLGFFIPDLKTPVLVLSGEKGTAKTTTSKQIIDLVSPTKVQAVVSMPTREDALVAQISNNYITAFDNLQFPIKPLFSDLLCQVVTHGSISKRRLYSTNDVAVFDLIAKLIMNGIDEIAARPDFAERCCVIYLERIPDEKRRGDKEIEEEFKTLKPRLLGAIFNTIAAVLADKTEFSSIPKPRMAEFAEFGMRVMTVLGEDPEAFLAQYKQIIEDQLADAEARSPVVAVVEKLLLGRRGEMLRESPTVLAQKFNGVAERNNIKITRQTANSITKTLKKHQHALTANGIKLSLPEGRTNRRWVGLQKLWQAEEVAAQREDAFAPKKNRNFIAENNDLTEEDLDCMDDIE